jgi:hypothetical protein
MKYIVKNVIIRHSAFMREEKKVGGWLMDYIFIHIVFIVVILNQVTMIIVLSSKHIY